MRLPSVRDRSTQPNFDLFFSCYDNLPAIHERVATWEEFLSRDTELRHRCELR